MATGGDRPRKGADIPRRGVVFGPFFFDPANGLLSGKSGEIPLPPLAVRVLEHLLSHAGEVVSKDALVQSCWDESHVSDDSLVHVVSEIRHALGDDSRDPRYIQTLPRRGYRFIATVQAAGETPATSGNAFPGRHQGAGPGAAPPERPLWRALVLSAAVIAAVALLSWAWLVPLLIEGRAAGVAPRRVESLAVLPFDNLMDDPQQEYFVQGIHDALITDLSKIPGLTVISRTSMMRYRDAQTTIPQIARELDVDAVIEGSVLKAGSRVRITAQLIDGETDMNMWAQGYERDLVDLVDLVGEVTRAIAAEIEVRLATDSAARPAAATLDPAAHDAYLRGRYAFNRFTRAGFQDSIEHFEEAIEIEPEFARAWASLGGSHLLLGAFGPGPRVQDAERARRAASRALELNGNLSEAHSVLGWVKMYLDWDWEGAAESFRRALELDPNDSGARHGYADYLAAIGRMDESLEQVRLGRRSDPFSPIVAIPGVGHLFFARRYEQAAAAAREALSLFPEPEEFREWLAFAAWQLERHAAAVAQWEQYLPADAAAGLRAACDRDGPGVAVEWMAARQVRRAEAGEVAPLVAGMWLAWAGQVDEAFDWLQQAYTERAPTLFLLAVDPRFDSLRADPRYADLIERLGLPTHPS